MAALQAGVIAVGGAALWLLADGWVAVSFLAGGSCVLAGTAAYGLCLALNRSREPGRLLRAHLVGQTAKVAVAVTLLIAGLSSRWEFAAASLVAGFAAGTLAYPFALLVNIKTDRN